MAMLKGFKDTDRQRTLIEKVEATSFWSLPFLAKRRWVNGRGSSTLCAPLSLCSCSPSSSFSRSSVLLVVRLILRPFLVGFFPASPSSSLLLLRLLLEKRNGSLSQTPLKESGFRSPFFTLIRSLLGGRSKWVQFLCNTSKLRWWLSSTSPTSSLLSSPPPPLPLPAPSCCWWWSGFHRWTHL